MEKKQIRYIEYVKEFSRRMKIHMWLGGSFLKGSSSDYSDVDIAMLTSQEKDILDFIQGYGVPPIYISKTVNPLGIIVVIYKDGVAVDLEIVMSINEKIDDLNYYHAKDIKQFNYKRNEVIWKKIVVSSDPMYELSRLFHRSLVKFLSGKKKLAIDILNEIAKSIQFDIECNEQNYVLCAEKLLYQVKKRYLFPALYEQELIRLMKVCKCQIT